MFTCVKHGWLTLSCISIKTGLPVDATLQTSQALAALSAVSLTYPCSSMPMGLPFHDVLGLLLFAPDKPSTAL